MNPCRQAESLPIEIAILESIAFSTSFETTAWQCDDVHESPAESSTQIQLAVVVASLAARAEIKQRFGATVWAEMCAGECDIW